MEQLDFNDIFEYPIDITTRYFAEVAEIAVPHSAERESALVECARKGDTEARERIIHHCLTYVIHFANTFYKTLTTHHDEFLDLIAIGNIELVEKLDVALEKENPISYLLMRAKFAIQSYCYFRSDLIARPKGLERKDVTSLDVLTDEQFLDFPIEEKQEEHVYIDPVLYAALHEAIEGLTDIQKEVMVRHYGLFGMPEEQLFDITPENKKYAYTRHTKAIYSLRKKLAGLM